MSKFSHHLASMIGACFATFALTIIASAPAASAVAAAAA